jgi:hypothetical protein
MKESADANRAKSFARAANWTVGLAAAALVLISVGDYFYHRERLAAIAAEHLRLVVTGPSRLYSGVAAEYLVSATTIGGRPLPAEIEMTLSAADGARVKAHQETADEHGRLRLVVPADLKLPPRTQLKIAARHGKSREEAEVALTVEPFRYAAFVPRRPPAAKSEHKKPPSAVRDASVPDVALTVAADAFAAGAPLELTVVAGKAGLPLVVAAYCDGVQVGEQPLVTKTGGPGGNPAAISLDDAVGGPIRLVVYDYSTAPPQPVAERLVNRPASRSLSVRIEGLRKRYAPGDKVDLSLVATNEKGQPVPAALSVLVVAGAKQDPAHSGQGGQVGNLSYGETPPWMYDNLAQIRSDFKKSFADYHAGRTPALNTLTTASFFGGLGLVLLVAMLGLLRIVSGMHLWISAVGAATCCLIIGAILMDPGRLTPSPDEVVGFSSYTPPVPAAGASEGDSPFFVERKLGQSPLPITPLPIGGPAKTLLWRPLLIAGPDGKASVSFKLPDGVAAFSVAIDARGDGRLGSVRAESPTP